MLELINKLLKNDKIRYIFAGGLTTLVNYIVFFSLRVFTNIERNVSNIIAIIMAMIFAYFINKLFVFESKTSSVSDTIREAVAFFGARLISMFVEVLGLAIVCDSFRIPEWIAKLFIVQIIVLVLNYIFSKVLVFNRTRKPVKTWLTDNYCYYIPFVLMMIIFTVVFIVEKITPFGPNTITIIDSLHQYIPFYAEYVDKLKNEGSLFYTWNLALGSNFMSLSAYYLSSPFNYLLLLFDKAHIVTGACLVIALKVSLSGSTMAYYLAHKDSASKVDKSFKIIALAMCYSLSNYVVGYNWCTMWMDVIMIFPLIMLGFERLMKQDDPKLYVLTLFYALYCNYYIGFIVCLFLVLWFIFYNHKGVKRFFIDGIHFGISSLIAGGMAAFLLLPAYFGIMSTAAGEMKLPKWEWYGNILQLLRQQFFLTMPLTNQTFDGGVNLYCGMLPVFTLFLYIFTGRIKVFDKVKNILLLAIIAVSFNSTTLNYIWHGFHDQYGIPNRFSFLFDFILIMIAYDVLKRMSKMSCVYITVAFFLTLAYFCLCNMGLDQHMERKIYIASWVMASLYCAICMMYSYKIFNSLVFDIVITIVCVAELAVSGVSGFLYNGYSNYEDKYRSTPQVMAANERVAELAEEDGELFYRSELAKSIVLDEVTYHNMPSVGTFCSTVLGELTTTMGKLGFYTGANEFLYMGASPFTDSLFDVRYVLKRDGDLDNLTFDYAETVEGGEIYENPYPLSIGFTVSDKVKEWNRNAGYPFVNLTNLAYYMTGFTGFMRTVEPDLIVASDNCDVSTEGNKVTFTPHAATDVSFIASFYAEEPGDYYINCRGNGIYKVRFYINGGELAYDRYQGQIFHLGVLSQGDYVSVEYCYNDKSTSTNTATVALAIFNEGSYKNVYNRLNLNKLKIEGLDDGYLVGEVNMPEGDTLFTSIPYDKGWSVEVDGVKTDYYEVLDAFIGIDMSEGQHRIRMVYTPVGLYAGMLISLVAWVAFIGIIMYNSHKKRVEKSVKNNNDEIDLETNL